MMQKVNIHQAKTHLSRLLEQVCVGKEIVISKAGKPVDKLVSLDVVVKRKPGLLKGKIHMTSDFDAPLPADLVSSFEGYSG